MKPSTFPHRFRKSGFDNNSSYPFKYVCNGNEMDYFSCYLTDGDVCRQRSESNVDQFDIAIECDSECIDLNKIRVRQTKERE